MMSLIMEHASHVIRSGSTNLIIDCGAGTVDLTCSRITSISPLKTSEVISPKGGAWGGLAIDHAFVTFLKELLGSKLVKAMDSKGELRTEVLRDFESAKISYHRSTGQSDRPRTHFTLSFGMLEDHISIEELKEKVTTYNASRPTEHHVVHVKRYNLSIPRSLIGELSTLVMEKVVEYVEGTVREVGEGGIQQAFVVGGFGESVHLFERLKEALGAHHIPLYSCVRPSLAIANGALLLATTNSVTHRTARLTYGFSAFETFKESHNHLLLPENNKEDERGMRRDDAIRSIRQRRLRGDQIRVFKPLVRKGDEIACNYVTPRITLYPLTSDQTSITFEILTSEEREPLDPQDLRVVKVGGSITIDVDMTVSHLERAYQLEIEFGGSEQRLRIYPVGSPTPLQDERVHVRLL
jgi:hypothetical protein